MDLRSNCCGRSLFWNRTSLLITMFLGVMMILFFRALTQSYGQVDSYTPGVGLNSYTKFGMNSTNDIYAVIFDAGSTGSRIHVYHFQQNEGANIELIHETFEQVKPGLSNYSTNPEEGAASLQTMLNTAMSEVPDTLQPVTPLVLKATAGLRLLPNGVADNLLNEVSSLFSQTRFQLVEGSVQILEGVDEGIFSWVTVNYLEGAFAKDGETVAALDLGGGSTQITFVPKNKDTLDSVPAVMLKQAKLFGKTFTLYTHSYLGLGLMSARFRAMGGKEEEAGATSDHETLFSPCLPPNHDISWVHHGGIKFKLKGLPESESGYTKCYKSIKPLMKTNVMAIPELKEQKIYAFSYFFDRAVESDLIDEVHGGVILVKDYQEAAAEVCDNQNSEMPFLCMDLTYIYSLLKDGYKLDLNTKLHITKKIKRIEVSWALGAAFHVLSSMGQLT